MEMKYNLLDLDKELAQSKINIDLKEINNNENKENKFLVSKAWDCLDDNKIFDLDNKVEAIIKELNQDNIKKLVSDINNCDFENFYKNYYPMENIHRIGCICSLNCLIESTYYTQDIDNESKLYDLNELSPYIYKFRNILGDGNCFFRGLIFSILENIILTNNIMQMKELLIMYYEKININNKLIKEKEFLQIIEKMNISIVSEIMYILISQMETNIKKAYIALLKVFLFNKDFDFGIIFFTRYLIYEYISANEDKIYSKEYQVEVGCLLPDDYIIDKGDKNEYYFENFYSLELMCPNIFAEKIVLYMAPYVFNINMNVLVYDFGINGEKSVIQEKEFFNENKSNFQIQVNLLFRKAHYDVYYKLNFYEDYKENLNILINRNDDIDKFEKENNNENHKDIEKNENENIERKNDNDNDKNMNFENIPNKNQENIKKDDNEGKDINYNADEINEYIKNEENYNKLENKNNSPICLDCKKPYTNKENVFGLCNDCLSNQLKSILLIAYLDFVKDFKNLANSLEKFREFIKKKKCKISVQENISLFDAIYNSDFNYNNLFASIRSQLCLLCGKNINFYVGYFLELPCKCRLCSKICFTKYLNVIKNHIIPQYEPKYHLYINLLSCFCGFIYNTKNILNMIKEMEKNQMKEQKKIYQDYIYYFWNWRCCMCKKNFEKEAIFCKINFKCNDIDKKLLDSNTKFHHLLCGECFHEYNVKVLRRIDCNICELEHEIKKFSKVNQQNEEIEEEKDCIFI